MAQPLTQPLDGRVSREGGDYLDDADRERLHGSLDRSRAQFADGAGVPADAALRRLRRR